MEKSIHHRVPNAIILYVIRMLEKQQMVCRDSNGVQCKGKMEQGTPQREPLSICCLYFVLGINELLEEYSNCGSITPVAYADDIALVMPNIDDIESVIESFSWHAARCGLILNPNKTKLGHTCALSEELRDRLEAGK